MWWFRVRRSATGDVTVTMKDFSITTSAASFPAGDITFGIQNDGPSAHEFVIIRTDDAPDALPVENGEIPRTRSTSSMRRKTSRPEPAPRSARTSCRLIRLGVQPSLALRGGDARGVHRQLNLSLFLATHATTLTCDSSREYLRARNPRRVDSPQPPVYLSLRSRAGRGLGSETDRGQVARDHCATGRVDRVDHSRMGKARGVRREARPVSHSGAAVLG